MLSCASHALAVLSCAVFTLVSPCRVANSVAKRKGVRVYKSKLWHMLQCRPPGSFMPMPTGRVRIMPGMFFRLVGASIFHRSSIYPVRSLSAFTQKESHNGRSEPDTT
jgi:hypothetical protein